LVVSRIPASGVAQDLLWRASDNTILFAVYRDGIYKVPATGGTPELFLRLDPEKEVDFHAVAEVPGDRFIITTHRVNERQGSGDEQCELYDGSRRTVLLAENITHCMYAAPGYLLFARTNTNAGVWAMPFAAQPLDLAKAVRVE